MNVVKQQVLINYQMQLRQTWINADPHLYFVVLLVSENGIQHLKLEPAVRAGQPVCRISACNSEQGGLGNS